MTRPFLVTLALVYGISAAFSALVLHTIGGIDGDLWGRLADALQSVGR